MFNFFKKKPAEPPVSLPELMDIFQMPLQEGDLVESLRYELGTCRLIRVGKSYAYESVSTGEQVSYLRMIDAITQRQKVKKVHRQQYTVKTQRRDDTSGI